MGSFHSALVLTQRCYTILLSHPYLGKWWCAAVVAALIPPWMVFVMHRLHAWGPGTAYYLALSAANVPLLHPIPMNTSLNSLCSCCVISALALISTLFWGPGMQYFILLLLSTTVGLSPIFEFEIMSVYVYIAPLKLACLLPVVCALPLIFHLIMELLSLCLHVFCVAIFCEAI